MAVPSGCKSIGGPIPKYNDIMIELDLWEHKKNDEKLAGGMIINNPASRPFPERIGPYRITGILGQGGMGVVYRGEKSGSAAAIKTVLLKNERHLSSIRREIRALANLNHPGIVKILEEGIENGKPWFAMELLTGMNLSQYCFDVIWKDSDAVRNWITATRHHFVPGTSTQKESQWWSKLLGTTLDATIWTENTGLKPAASIEVPKPVHEAPTPAAGGKLPDVCSVFYSICMTLGYLHGQGIVHRDLKPSNIILKPCGTPVLMDFGLVQEFWRTISRDDLTSLNTAGGTLLYISPEQVTSDVLDARADLYALGCMLYEFVTGHVPFIAHSIFQAMMAHLRLLPVPPSQIVEDIPVELESMILRLLEKRPQDRMGHASDVADILKKFGAETKTPYPAPEPYIYRSRFTGRNSFMEKINSNLRDIDLANGKCILISGEIGVGKTRFLQEIWRLAARYKITVFSGECLPESGPQEIDTRTSQNALGVFQNMFREIVEFTLSSGQSAAQSIFGSNRKILAPFFPEVVNIPGFSEEQDPPELEPLGAQMRLFSAISQVLTQITTIKPIVLLLDDLQWMDELTANTLSFLIRTGSISRMRIVLVATFRLEDINPSLERILRVPQIEHLRLMPLDKSAMEFILYDMLASSDPPVEFIQKISEFSKGNPFFAAEYLRTCISEGILKRGYLGKWLITNDDETTLSTLESLPNTLLNLIKRKMASLSEKGRLIAEISAVLGREIEELLLYHMVPHMDDALDAIDELIRFQVMEESSPGTLRFTNDLIQQLIINELKPDRKQQLHSEAAHAIEVLYQDQLDQHLSLLAYHHHFAGHKKSARNFYLAAARKAASELTPSLAERFYKSYFELSSEITEEKIRARNEFARTVLRLLGKTRDALRQHRTALKESKVLSNKTLTADSLIGISQFDVIHGNHNRAEILLQKSLDLYRQQNNLPGEMKALKRLGFIQMRKGHFSEARSLFLQALKLSRNHSDRANESAILAELGYLHYKESKLDLAMENYQESVKIQRELNNRYLEASNLRSMALIYSAKGEFLTAKNCCENAMETFRAIGAKNKEGQLAYQLANIELAGGNFPKALDLLSTALLIRREQNDRAGEGMILTEQGEVLFSLGRFDEAELALQQAIEIFDDMNLKHYSITSMLRLSKLQRLVYNNLERAIYWANEGMNRAMNIPDWNAVCKSLSQLLHISLALNDPNHKDFARFKNTIDKQNLHGYSDISNALCRLNAAMNAFENGDKLIRGESPDTIPKSIQNIVNG